MNDEIKFEVSSLKLTPDDLSDHFEIKFSKGVSGNWLIQVIKWALLLDSFGYDIYDLAKEANRNARAKFRIMTS